jgi:cell division protein ZapE
VADFFYLYGFEMNVQEFYQDAIDRRGFKLDGAQQRAVARLQQAYDEWVFYKGKRANRLTRLISKPEIPKGVYMWGGVGRGKSFLMDSFFLLSRLFEKSDFISTNLCAMFMVSLMS